MIKEFLNVPNKRKLEKLKLMVRGQSTLIEPDNLLHTQIFLTEEGGNEVMTFAVQNVFTCTPNKFIKTMNEKVKELIAIVEGKSKRDSDTMVEFFITKELSDKLFEGTDVDKQTPKQQVVGQVLVSILKRLHEQEEELKQLEELKKERLFIKEYIEKNENKELKELKEALINKNK